MSLIYAFAISAQMGAGIYLLLSRHVMRILFGVVLLSAAVNLLIFVAGGLQFTAPPIIPKGDETLGAESANPLPQALILTAIVIGFALVSFAAALVLKAYSALGSVFTDEQNAAEELGSPFDKEATRNG
ncbi:Multiple resistance and pH homeostasis protein C [Pannonibacter phragmitetus]|uniref:Multiple resistance and pH homeostasis protein C n=1 Tax=Pannonibacter phragmitetus TaxID=121719 RepID=A0A378ZZK4_9HYPH|nr:NADH-quinone oxidoreductase subunit K [Pannonibacter phragmitetus]SUB02309.1 Multiple resistance and pH homeostasis protein C [Pannonibacter phragmitetus]